MIKKITKGLTSPILVKLCQKVFLKNDIHVFEFEKTGFNRISFINRALANKNIKECTYFLKIKGEIPIVSSDEALKFIDK